MAGCVLRAAGPGLPSPASLGDLRLPNASMRADSLSVTVSYRGGHDLAGQVRDALRFLDEHRAVIDALASAPDVALVLDFGLWQREASAQSVSLPKALVARAGELGIGLEVSIYSLSA